MNSRLEVILKDNFGYRYDVVNAIVCNRDLQVYKTYLRAAALAEMAKTDSILQLVTLHKRLKNIVSGFETFNLSEKLFSESEEKILFEIFRESKEKIEELILRNDFILAGSEILEMKPVIDNFFDKILVMDKNEKIKHNRIALIQKIDELLSKIADFSLIIDTEN